jgi:hypothetical protein
MTSKEKKRLRQEERDIKRMNDIISGRVTVEMPKRPKKSAQANRIGGAASVEEQDYLAECYMRLLRFLLPGILAELSSLNDVRDQNRIKHSLPALILYGILLFLCHTSSRRAANREVGGSQLYELMEEFVPDFRSMPHADTLARLNKGIDANELESKYEGLIEGFIKSPQFNKLNPGRFLIAVDGTQKFSRTWCWDSRALSKNAGDPDKERYSAYMLESVLVLDNGMVLPLLTETLENGECLDGNGKQDCERKAFKRLAERLMKLFGKGCVTVVLDGLYATGPVISQCKNYGWEYMITLKSECLKTVWEDFNGLRKIEHKNNLTATYDDGLIQEYDWSNGIEYTYGDNHKRLSLNVVTCQETWYDESKIKGKPCQKATTFSWLSSSKLNRYNVVGLCMIARRRWRIENHFLMVKTQGYEYEHCFSYNWNAMKCYNCLLKIANFINTIILHSQLMQDYVIAEGKQGVIKKVWNYMKIQKLSDFCPELVSSDITKDKKKIHYGKLKIKAAA